MPFNPDLQLNAVVVNLIATNDGGIPLTQGALAHAAFLDLVRAADSDLAARLHEGGNPRYGRGLCARPMRGLCARPMRGLCARPMRGDRGGIAPTRRPPASAVRTPMRIPL